MNLTHATSYPFCSFRWRVRITPLMRHRMNHRVIGRFFEELCFVMCLDLSFTCGCDLCLDLVDCVCEFVTCGCDIWLVVAICCYLSYGCDIMCENGFVVIYMWLLWCLWYICDMWYIFELFCVSGMQKTKKNCNFGWFAECNGHGTRQSWETLLSGRTLHSAKIFF